MEATDGAVRFNDKLVTEGALKPLLSCESSARIRQRSAGGSFCGTSDDSVPTRGCHGHRAWSLPWSVNQRGCPGLHRMADESDERSSLARYNDPTTDLNLRSVTPSTGGASHDRRT